MSQTNILEYLRKTPHNTNVNVVKGMIGNTGSSDGLSDVSIATVICDGCGEYINGPILGEDYRVGDTAVSYKELADSPTTVEMVLYKGKAVVNIPLEVSKIEGNAEILNAKEGTILITGDCTLTGQANVY